MNANMFQLYSGKAPEIIWMPKKASTVFANGALTYADGSGAIQPADATSGNHLGIILKAVAATDDDYASNTLVPVLIPRDDNNFLVDVGTGTLTTAMVGNQYDLADSVSIDVSAQSKNIVTIVEFVSASLAVVKINAMVANVNVATT